MQPRIETLTAKKLIGKYISMSIAENKTQQLWKSFMPRRNEIVGRINADMISMQVYGDSFNFNDFDFHATFNKWAAAEVSDFDFVPPEMETFLLSGGLYAVFDYKGRSTDTEIFKYIYGTWLPGSAFELDNRPHFEILGQKYKNNDPDSEEEIWIPVKYKT